METLTVGLVSIATAILILGFEPVVGTSHWGLLNYDVTWFMQMTVWYCESYLPVKYTKQKLALMKEIVPTSHKLEKTLVDEELLLKFELHLIDEWSPENLQFFKNAVICRYQIQKNYEKIKRGETLRKQLSLKESANALLKRAQKATFRIYFHFIRDNAVSQVNIPADVLSELEDYFSASCFEDLRIQFYGMTHVSALSRSATADEERAAMVVAPADDDSRGRAKTFHGEAPQEFNPIGQVSPTLSQGASRGATPRNAPLDSGLRMDSELGKGTPTASEIRG